MHVYTVGHGARTADEVVSCLIEAGVATVLDVRRYPSSRRHPHFNRGALEDSLRAAGIAYRHVEELGGRRSAEPGEERFACVRPAAFASYAAHMGSAAWQDALSLALESPAPCLLCAETRWQDCHRRLIAELLVARGAEVVHLVRPGEREPHVPSATAEAKEGRLYLCGELVA